MGELEMRLRNGESSQREQLSLTLKKHLENIDRPVLKPFYGTPAVYCQW